MKKRITVHLIAGVSLFLLAGTAIAEETFDLEALRAERSEKLDRYFVRARTQKRLSDATVLLESSEFDAARELLERLNPARLNAHERALVYQFLAYAAVGQEEPEQAIQYYEKVVKEQVLLVDDEASARYKIAEIHASLEQWEEVDETLNEWFKYVDHPNAAAYYLLAISRHQRELYDEALPPALMALKLSRQPKERWLQLVAALHLQKEDYDSAVPILEELVTRFPKKRYWTQLSLIYGARGDYERSLRVQQLAYAQNFLTQNDELRRLARSYLFHQLPYPAAQVLERGLAESRIDPDGEVLELLGNAWIAAREYEKSIEPLQRAADLAQDGRLYFRLGQVRVQSEDWEEAASLIERAIEKGGLVDLGKAHMLLGISYYGNGRAELASAAFREARRHESTRDDAKVWLEHIARQSQEG